MAYINGRETFFCQADKYYDAFWDAYQSNGARRDYSRAFYGGAWTTNNFKPKYTIKSTSCSSMFRESLLSGLHNYSIDTSECTNFSDMFNNAWGVIRVPPMSLEKLTSGSAYVFATGVITTIDCLTVSTDTTFNNTCFYGLSGVVTMRFKGTIASSLNLQWSKKLDAESIINIIDTLSDETTGKTLTLSTAAQKTVETKYENYWSFLISKKSNWTISLV